MNIEQTHKFKEDLDHTVGVFYDHHNVDEAIKDLEATQFARHDISLLTADEIEQDDVTSTAQKPETEPLAQKTPIREEEIGIGTGFLIGIPIYIAIVTVSLVLPSYTNLDMNSSLYIGLILGALAGFSVAYFAKSRLDEVYEKQEKNGGLRLQIKTINERRTALAERILSKHGATAIYQR